MHVAMIFHQHGVDSAPNTADLYREIELDPNRLYVEPSESQTRQLTLSSTDSGIDETDATETAPAAAAAASSSIDVADHITALRKQLAVMQLNIDEKACLGLYTTADPIKEILSLATQAAAKISTAGSASTGSHYKLRSRQLADSRCGL
jgi:hypothetical protein